MRRSRSNRYGLRVEDKELGHHYRSGLEAAIAADLKAKRIPFEFEPEWIEYEVPSRKAKYKFDFRLPNGIIVEGKGEFDTADRQKHLLVKEQHPHLDIRFVFSNSRKTISKKSTTTYAMWCEKHGFKFADKLIPIAWTREAANVCR